jgi:hypothetical protein
MRDWGSVLGTEHLVLAETLGLAMARRAAEILERHRMAVAGGPGLTGGAGKTGSAPVPDDEQFATDNAIFTAVLDAANECLGRFDARPADDRWCDALLQLIQLAQFADDTDSPFGPASPLGPIDGFPGVAG